MVCPCENIEKVIERILRKGLKCANLAFGGSLKALRANIPKKKLVVHYPGIYRYMHAKLEKKLLNRFGDIESDSVRRTAYTE